MKKWLYAAGLGLVMASSASVMAADKIAIVNVEQVLKQMPAREAVLGKLKEEFKSRGAQLQSQQSALQSQMQRFQRDSSTMKASERTKMEKSLMAQQAEFSTKAQAYERDSMRRQSEETGKLMDRIRTAVKSVADKGDYDVVIDSNAVTYIVGGRDITADVLKQVK